MSLLHCLAAYGRGHLTGVQSTQRDWSPFLAHFTSWASMGALRSAVKDQRSPQEVGELFADADGKSWESARRILEAGRLIAHSPSEKNALPPCVCLSECALPGLISHCERYGRFGFVFGKRAIYEAGGRPCLYVASDEYRVLAERGRGQGSGTPEGRLFALSNVYEPPRSGTRLQDYTHEREWRVFGDIDLAATKVEAILAPSAYAARALELVEGVPVVPLDTLFEWGA